MHDDRKWHMITEKWHMTSENETWRVRMTHDERKWHMTTENDTWRQKNDTWREKNDAWRVKMRHGEETDARSDSLLFIDSKQM